MRFSGIALVAGCAAVLHAGTAQASTVFLPVAGDVFRYALSSGERVTLEIVSVRQQENKVLAKVRETKVLPGGESEHATFDLIRTPTSLAIDIPPAGDNARLSPLVYFFAPANPQDSWMAQQGIFLDSAGSAVRYQVTARLEAIETVTGPAGTFEGCRRITYSSSLSDGLPLDRITQLTVWMHPDVGIVRSFSRTGADSRLTELVQYRKFSEAPGSASTR